MCVIECDDSDDDNDNDNPVGLSRRKGEGCGKFALCCVPIEFQVGFFGAPLIAMPWVGGEVGFFTRPHQKEC